MLFLRPVGKNNLSLVHKMPPKDAKTLHAKQKPGHQDYKWPLKPDYLSVFGQEDRGFENFKH